MWNEVSESNADLDLGAGGPMLLPDLTDITGTVKHLGFSAGKDGFIYIVSRARQIRSVEEQHLAAD
jgi:hypothetical protein